jgi:hypothetical protein
VVGHRLNGFPLGQLNDNCGLHATGVVVLQLLSLQRASGV